MSDLEELKRKYINRTNEPWVWLVAIAEQFPALVAKVEAGEVLRDAIAAQHCNGACVGNGKSIVVRNAIAAFDKEQTE